MRSGSLVYPDDAWPTLGVSSFVNSREAREMWGVEWQQGGGAAGGRVGQVARMAANNEDMLACKVYITGGQ